jgi:hypothetical protein
VKIVTQSRYAVVASTAALLVALGGTSYAAVMITGHEIKNGTVTTKDVRNHNLKLKDFSSSAKAGLHGATGAAGPQGIQGPIGPSNAYSVHNDDGTALTSSSKTVLSQQGPAGSYVVNSKAMLLLPNGQANCVLSAVGQLDVNEADTGADTSHASVANQLAFTTQTATSVDLDCTGTGPLFFKKLTAIQVGSVSNTPGPIVAKADGGMR